MCHWRTWECRDCGHQADVPLLCSWSAKENISYEVCNGNKGAEHKKHHTTLKTFPFQLEHTCRNGVIYEGIWKVGETRGPWDEDAYKEYVETRVCWGMGLVGCGWWSSMVYVVSMVWYWWLRQIYAARSSVCVYTRGRCQRSKTRAQ